MHAYERERSEGCQGVPCCCGPPNPHVCRVPSVREPTNRTKTAEPRHAHAEQKLNYRLIIWGGLQHMVRRAPSGAVGRAVDTTHMPRDDVRGSGDAQEIGHDASVKVLSALPPVERQRKGAFVVCHPGSTAGHGSTHDEEIVVLPASPQNKTTLSVMRPRNATVLGRPASSVRDGHVLMSRTCQIVLQQDPKISGYQPVGGRDDHS